MNCGDKSLAGIFSAKQLARTDEMCRALERAAQAENERKRKVGEATIELNEQTKKQKEILKAQLVEAQKAHELLVKQAEDSAKSARVSLWIAIASLVATVVSIVVMLVI